MKLKKTEKYCFIWFEKYFTIFLMKVLPLKYQFTTIWNDPPENITNTDGIYVLKSILMSYFIENYSPFLFQWVSYIRYICMYDCICMYACMCILMSNVLIFYCWITGLHLFTSILSLYMCIGFPVDSVQYLFLLLQWRFISSFIIITDSNPNTR